MDALEAPEGPVTDVEDHQDESAHPPVRAPRSKGTAKRRVASASAKSPSKKRSCVHLGNGCGACELLALTSHHRRVCVSHLSLYPYVALCLNADGPRQQK